MEPRRLSRGFTLVERLGVIAIIGILIALLLPAVQAAREAARRIQCTNHVKENAFAMLHFHEQYGFLPSGGWGYQWGVHPGRGMGKEQPGGWGWQILAFMDQMQLANFGTEVDPDNFTDARLRAANKTLNTQPLSTFYCPSRRAPGLYPMNSISYVQRPFLSDTLTEAVRTDYAANGGEDIPNDPVVGVWGFGPGPSESYAAYVAYKKFPSPDYCTGIYFTRSQFNLAEVTDGTSSTYLVGEKYLDPAHYYDGQSLGDDQGPYNSDERDLVRFARSGGTYLRPRQDTPGYNGTWEFGSAHPSGFNMAMCDGSVRLIGYEVEEAIHYRLANRMDGVTVEQGSY